MYTKELAPHPADFSLVSHNFRARLAQLRRRFDLSTGTDAIQQHFPCVVPKKREFTWNVLKRTTNYGTEAVRFLAEAFREMLECAPRYVPLKAG
jgi:hypothetical protein